MSASITWTDAEGTSSLATFAGIPNRFNSWTPDFVPIGPTAVGLGTGQTYNFPFRNDLTVALEISPLVGADLELALRLKMHLMSGGQVAVSTTNFMSTAFETCILAPGTTPQVDFVDPVMMEYAFSVVLRSGTGLAATGGGRITPWEPGDLAGMILWLRADSLTGAVDGDPIALWSDESGYTRNAVQATTGKYPLYRPNIVNGLPVLRFDGSDDGLLINPMPGVTYNDGFTVFIVYSSNSASGGIRAALSGGTLQSSMTIGPWDNQWKVLMDYAGVGLVHDGTCTLGEFSICMIRKPIGTSGASQYWRNDHLVTSVTGNLSGFGTQLGIGVAGAGYGNNWPAPIDGDVAEIMIWGSYLNDPDTADVWTYLSDKYGITLTP